MLAALHPSWLFESAGAFYAVTSSWLCFVLGFAAWHWRHTCHGWRGFCPKWAHHRLADGTPICRRHHPSLPNYRRSLSELHDHHRKAQL